MNARFVTEAGLDQEFAVHAKLESKGNYGCGCAVFDGDVTLTELAFEDEWFQDLTERNHPADVGTVLFSGNVHCKDTSVSDRLMVRVHGVESGSPRGAMGLDATRRGAINRDLTDG